MGRKISHQLNDLGFFCAFGTTESSGEIVKRGRPFTWDRNNGITAVYDEEGKPWIHSITPAIELNTEFERGAYVPHSNDGGKFLREILSKL